MEGRSNMPKPTKYKVWFDEDGVAVKARTRGGQEFPDQSGGKPFPEGTIADISTFVTVKTNPCYWIMIGGRWYCLPF